MSRTARIVEAAARGEDPPELLDAEDRVYTEAGTAAPPAPNLPPRLPLPSTPAAKLEAHRATVRHLAALVAASDANLAELSRRESEPQSVVAHFESQPTKIKDVTGELAKAKARLAELRAAAVKERETSRDLRQDLEAARRVLTTLEAFASTYGIQEGDSGKTVRIKVVMGTLKCNGKTVSKGQTTLLDEPAALRLVQRGFAEIVGN